MDGQEIGSEHHRHGSHECESAGQLLAEIAVDGLDFRTVCFADPVPLGRQILASVGLHPAESFQAYAILACGDFEELRLNETFDLREKGVERFVCFTSDRVYRFIINEREIKWGPAHVSEGELRYLGAVPSDQVIFLEVRGGTDRLIAEGEWLDLAVPGVERFVSARRTGSYTLFIDGVKYESEQQELKGAQIKALVRDWDPTHDLVLEGHGDTPDRVIADDEIVDLRTEHGPRRFSSVPKANFG